MPEEAGGASVFLTLEDNRDEIHRRTVALDPEGSRADLPCYVIPAVEVCGFDPTLVVARGRAAALTAFAETGLDAMLEEASLLAGRPVRLLVLDPAGDFLNADENDSTVVKMLMHRLRETAAQHCCTIILLGHVAKAMDSAAPSMRGSSAWVANSRFAFALWQPSLEEAGKLSRKLGVDADRLVWGNLVKANHAGAPIGRKQLFRRDPETGRLAVVAPAQASDRGPSEEELLSILVAACADYAAAGMPFTHTGASGLWEGREDLPPELSSLSKARLAALGAAALEAKLLVKTRTGIGLGAPKYLDLPNGPLARGEEVKAFRGSRREALAQRQERPA